MGFGLGLSLLPAMHIVLGNLAPERAGVGAALITALRQAGSGLGIAVFGSALSTVYIGLSRTEDLSPSDAATVESSIAGAREVARSSSDPTVLSDAASAFVSGMDLVLAVCALLTLLAAATAARFLPGRHTEPAQEQESVHDGTEAART